MKTIICYLSKVFLSLVLYSTFVLAQDIWQLPLAGSSVSLEYLSPSLSDIYSSSKVTMYSILASGKYQFCNNDYLIITIPYVHYHMDAYNFVFIVSGNDFSYSQSEYNSGNIGNLYFAYDFRGHDEHFSATIGIYLPTASEKEAAPAAGSLFDYDRFALYTPNLVTLRPQFNYHSESSDFFVTITGSPTITYSTKEVSGETVDIFMALSLQGGFKVGDFSAAAGWAANCLATASGQISDRIVDQAGVIVGYKIANIHPELLFRFPLSNNLSIILNYVICLSARYEF